MEIAWECTQCGWTDSSPNLGGPIMHETITGHVTVPATKAIREWGKVL